MICKSLCVIALSIPVLHGCSSEWAAPDKQLHFKYGVAIGAAVVTGLNFIEADVNRPLTAGLICSGVGALKEGYDEYSYGGADYKDFLVTATACFISSLTMNELLNLNVTPITGGALLNIGGKF